MPAGSLYPFRASDKSDKRISSQQTYAAHDEAYWRIEDGRRRGEKIYALEAEEGIAILPHGSKIFRNDALMFIPIADPSASIDIVVAWSPQHETPVLRPFLELVRRKRKKHTAS